MEFEDIKEIKPISEWNIGFEARPLVIAGPCSAENRKQVMDTAKLLADQGIKMFRAGIWKPRTRPGNFEGVGSKGLAWLRQVKDETGMLVGTEVAKASHVYEALKYGLDYLWIGARTTVSPFAIQEIANALEGVDIPVLIKNPVNPDIELWAGAVERLQKVGIDRIALLHRGFSSHNEGKYRNPPQWQIPIEMKQRFPTISIICDPSHMGGKREFLAELSQKALDLNFDGLMIESHFDPSHALSDAGQQLTPAKLLELRNSLIIRNDKYNDGTFSHKLEELRTKVDQIDDQLLEILEKRMKVTEMIGYYKKVNNVTILQGGRWENILKSRVEAGQRKGLSEEFMLKILRAVHQESINHQTQIMSDDNIDLKKYNLE